MLPQLSDDERKSLAGRVRMQRQKVFGTKSDAYKAASLNSATWDRIEAGLPVREDRLIAALKALWPKSDGDWTAISAEKADDLPLLGVGPDSPEYFPKLEAWVLELQRRIEGLEAYVRVDEGSRGWGEDPDQDGDDAVLPDPSDPSDPAPRPDVQFPALGVTADLPPGPLAARRGRRYPGHGMDQAGQDDQDPGQ